MIHEIYMHVGAKSYHDFTLVLMLLKLIRNTIKFIGVLQCKYGMYYYCIVSLMQKKRNSSVSAP